MSSPGPRSSSPAPSYRLVRRPLPAGPPPRLSPAQQAVVDHPGGPLLVLAGPGTGKTTTVVEAVVARVARGLDPERVLVLTFSRRAAAELRERVTARLGGTVREPVARTLHSYAFGVLRREAALRGEAAPRLLSGPEQDLVIRELLRGDIEHDDQPGERHRRWPASLRPALPTRGFAQELRDLLQRCAERGVGVERLEQLAGLEARADWRAVAGFQRQYAEVALLRAGEDLGTVAYDPAELIREVVRRWRAEPALLEAERARRSVVFVDEFQDTDPAQVELLELLAGGGRDLVAVGDPDQSIYGFRGAELQGLHDFPARFPTVTGAPAPTCQLDVCRRFGPALLDATRRVAKHLPPPSRHRDLRPGTGVAEGCVQVQVARSAGQEAALIAGWLRAAHLRDGVPWSGMAVLVRSTTAVLPVLRRALSGVGIPVAVPADEVPLVEQPALQPLLLLLRCAVEPSLLTDDRAIDLLLSPLGGADSLDVRRLRQELRRIEVAGGGRRPSGQLLVEALWSSGDLTLVPAAVRRPAERLAHLLSLARTCLATESTTAEDLLWTVWSASGLAGRWHRQSAAGGPRAAAADRDLDAVVALFDAAARFVDRLPAAGPGLFLEHVLGQQVPADTLAARSQPGEAVQVLTAHAAKGLEWDVVAVAGVQEGRWPDLRARGSFLGADRLVELSGGTALPAGAPAAIAAVGRRLEEERRLFYVATTRARRRLLVTAVTNEREDLQPSRFLDELDPPSASDRRRELTDPPRALTLSGIVAELRQVLLDPDPSLAALRAAAAAQLATLARAGVRGAAPDSWYGVLPLSDASPVADAGSSVTVSPSKLESFARCQLRWFLEHVGGTEAATTSQGVGTLVHAVAAGASAQQPGDEAALLRRLEELAAAADLGRGWAARRARGQAADMIRRLARWTADNSRTLVATELEFRAEVGRAVLQGRVDRLERDAQGRGVVVDLKTGTSKPADADLEEQPQLGGYQLAMAAGGFAGTGVTSAGGAELLQLGKGGLAGRARVQRQPALDEAPDPQWAERLVRRTAEGMAGSAFQAVENEHCRMCPVRSSCPLQDEGRQVTA